MSSLHSPTPEAPFLPTQVGFESAVQSSLGFPPTSRPTFPSPASMTCGRLLTRLPVCTSPEPLFLSCSWTRKACSSSVLTTFQTWAKVPSSQKPSLNPPPALIDFSFQKPLQAPTARAVRFRSLFHPPACHLFSLIFLHRPWELWEQTSGFAHSEEAKYWGNESSPLNTSGPVADGGLQGDHSSESATAPGGRPGLASPGTHGSLAQPSME